MTAAQLVEHLNRQAVSLMSELLCAHICICQMAGNLNICICSWPQLTRKMHCKMTYYAVEFISLFFVLSKHSVSSNHIAAV